MNLNGFSVDILPTEYVNRVQKVNSNYFTIPHMSEYQIKLTNNRPMRCDVQVFIDGESVGIWRVNAYSNIVIQRPANINRKFVFVAEKVYDPILKKLVHNKFQNGLITVIFKPEFPTPCPYSTDAYFVTPTFYNPGEYSWSNALQEPDTTYIASTGDVMQSTKSILDNSLYENGATILGGGTDQYFTVTTPIAKYDQKNTTTINLRLIPSIRQPYMTVKDLSKINVDRNLVYQVNDRLYNHPTMSIQLPYISN